MLHPNDEWNFGESRQPKRDTVIPDERGYSFRQRYFLSEEEKKSDRGGRVIIDEVPITSLRIGLEEVPEVGATLFNRLNNMKNTEVPKEGPKKPLFGLKEQEGPIKRA